MRKLKKGDDVIIITGKDKGKIGTISNIKACNYLIVQGINVVKKHQKPNPAIGSVGGIIDKEMVIHISNVAIYNFSSKKADKVGFKLDADNNKIRFFKSTNEVVES